MSDTPMTREGEKVREGVAEGFPRVRGRCPACNLRTLFLGTGGYVTCSYLPCPDPDAANRLLERRADD